MSLTLDGNGTIAGLQAGGLPDATVAQADLAGNVAGNGPAFSAYASVATSLVSSANTKIIFQAKEFDTASGFNTTTSKFTPGVPGYYMVTADVMMGNASAAISLIYKNGVEAKRGPQAVGGGSYSASVAALIYLGATDYLEVYCFQNAATQDCVTGSNVTYFQAFLARAA